MESRVWEWALGICGENGEMPKELTMSLEMAKGRAGLQLNG